MRPLTDRFPALTDAALALLRVAIGAVMLAHGLQKLLGGGIAGTTDGFRGMGIPLAEVAAPAVIAVEVLGGIGMIAGFLVPLVGLAFMVVLGVAGALVHGAGGFFAQDGGWEYTAVLALASLVLAVTGGGRLGVDAALAARRDQPSVGARVPAHG